MNQHARQAQPLLHAAAQGADERALFLAKPDQFQHIIYRLLALRSWDLVTGPEEIQVLSHFHVLINAEEIRHITDDMADRVGVAHYIMTEDLRAAGRRSQKR